MNTTPMATNGAASREIDTPLARIASISFPSPNRATTTKMLTKNEAGREKVR